MVQFVVCLLFILMPDLSKIFYWHLLNLEENISTNDNKATSGVEDWRRTSGKWGRKQRSKVIMVVVRS